MAVTHARRWMTLGLVLPALGLALSGCESFDLENIWNSKKPLPGDRRAVFPQGVPGVPQGVPPELVRGYQPPAAPEPVAAPEPAPRRRVAQPRPPAEPRPPRLRQQQQDTPQRPAAQPAAAQPGGAAPWPAPSGGGAPAASSPWPEPPPPPGR